VEGVQEFLIDDNNVDVLITTKKNIDKIKKRRREKLTFKLS
jgi:hypothetical protein